MYAARFSGAPCIWALLNGLWLSVITILAGTLTAEVDTMANDKKGETISDADRSLSALISDRATLDKNDSEGGGERARGFQKTNG